MDADDRERLETFVIRGADDGIGGFAMLKITENATTLLSEARASAGVPETFGVRFFLGSKGAPGSDQAQQITFTFVPSPEPSDSVVTEEKVPVYVAPDAAEAMEEATLDAQSDGGAGRRLVLRR